MYIYIYIYKKIDNFFYNSILKLYYTNYIMESTKTLSLPDSTIPTKNTENLEKKSLKKKKKKPRCFNCNKKLPKSVMYLDIQYKCKCSDTNLFCLECKPSINHNCTYNWVSNNKLLLTKNMQKADFQKVAVI